MILKLKYIFFLEVFKLFSKCIKVSKVLFESDLSVVIVCGFMFEVSSNGIWW